MGKVEPALTPEEWAKLLLADEWNNNTPLVPIHPEGFEYYERSASSLKQLHGIAAEVLYGQPFGFTWEDVDRLTDAADYIERADKGEGDYYADGGIPGEQLVAALRAHAECIAALLPPKVDAVMIKRETIFDEAPGRAIRLDAPMHQMARKADIVRTGSANVVCPMCGCDVRTVGPGAQIPNGLHWQGVECSGCDATYTIEIVDDPEVTP